MPCIPMSRPNMTVEETRDSVVDEVAKALRSRTANIQVIGGKVVIKGIDQSDKWGMHDICILRRMKLKGPIDMRMKLQNDLAISKAIAT